MTRVSSFARLTRARLALLPALMAADVGDWLHTRSEGSPRSRPRDEHTVRMNLNRVHPLLLEWAWHHTHLREVTADDVIAATEPLHGSLRRQTLTALRSLFGHAKKTGTIFRDPTRGVHDGQRPLILIQPLQPAEIEQATSAAVTPPPASRSPWPPSMPPGPRQSGNFTSAMSTSATGGWLAVALLNGPTVLL